MAFIVGEFDYVEGRDSNGVLVKVLSSKNEVLKDCGQKYLCGKFANMCAYSQEVLPRQYLWGNSRQNTLTTYARQGQVENKPLAKLGGLPQIFPGTSLRGVLYL